MKSFKILAFITLVSFQNIAQVKAEDTVVTGAAGGVTVNAQESYNRSFSRLFSEMRDDLSGRYAEAALDKTEERIDRAEFYGYILSLKAKGSTAKIASEIRSSKLLTDSEKSHLLTDVEIQNNAEKSLARLKHDHARLSRLLNISNPVTSIDDINGADAKERSAQREQLTQRKRIIISILSTSAMEEIQERGEREISRPRFGTDPG